jgi:hypothetical protein
MNRGEGKNELDVLAVVYNVHHVPRVDYPSITYFVNHEKHERT